MRSANISLEWSDGSDGTAATRYQYRFFENPILILSTHATALLSLEATTQASLYGGFVIDGNTTKTFQKLQNGDIQQSAFPLDGLFPLSVFRFQNSTAVGANVFNYDQSMDYSSHPIYLPAGRFIRCFMSTSTGVGNLYWSSVLIMNCLIFNDPTEIFKAQNDGVVPKILAGM